MKIEFGLPTGAGGMAAAYSQGKITTALKQWKEQYQVQIIVSTNRHDYRHWLTVEFAREEDLTLFALTWTLKTFMPWRILD